MAYVRAAFPPLFLTRDLGYYVAMSIIGSYTCLIFQRLCIHALLGRPGQLLSFIKQGAARPCILVLGGGLASPAD
jgi:hypothetical protein